MADPDYPNRIRAARAYAGLSQRELADRLGIERKTIVRREAGDGRPGPGEPLAIANATGVPAAFMVGGWSALQPTPEAVAGNDELLRDAIAVRRRLTEAKRAADAAHEGAREREDGPDHLPADGGAGVR